MKIAPRIHLLAAVMTLALIPPSVAIVVLARSASGFLGEMTAERTLMTQALRVERAVIDAETAQRAYLISGDRVYLDEFNRAHEAAEMRIDALQAAAGEHLDATAQIAAILRPAKAELALLDRLGAEGIGAAEEVVRDQQGRFEAQEMRQAVESFREDRARFLAASSDSMRMTLLAGQWLAIGGAVFGIIVVLVSLSVLSGYLRRSLSAFLNAIEHTDPAGIPQAVPSNLRGEFQTLGSAYNMMRSRIETEMVQRDEAESRIALLLSQSGEELADRTRVSQILGRISNRLPACLDQQELVTLALRFIPQLFETSRGALYFLNNSGTVLSCVASWGDCTSSIAEFPPTKCWGLRRGQQHYVDDVATDVTCEHIGQNGPDGYVCMPLIAQGETVGLLYLELTGEDAGAASRRDTEDMRMLCENLALALVNLRLRESLHYQSLRDPLTGLHNRRYLEEAIELEFAKSRRNTDPVSVIMCDVDHFKHINDRFGHDIGDLVLKRFAGALTANVRKGDVACRFGGEEFVILLPGLAHAEALERAEILRQQISQFETRSGDSHVGQVTASFGVATYCGTDETWSETLKSADSALYRAKAGGRNCVRSSEHSDPIALPAAA